MKLLIVESPTKAKKIANYLGDGWTVAASYGHIRDLPQREIGLAPPAFVLQYELTERARSNVPKLRELARTASHVYLATDPDREGEAISWHLKEAMRLSDGSYSRVTFNVVDAATVRSAVDKPRALDMPLVHAQEARRALDRLVGFMVSPAISDRLGMSLSAGRVQSPAVRLVVENERAIAAFKATHHFGAVIDFGGWKAAWDTKAHAGADGYVVDQALAESAARCRSFKVTESAQRKVSDAPPAPFNTSSLLQAASVALKFEPDKTMKVAQALFEQHGVISYHRTDSLNLDAATAAGIRAMLEADGLPAAPEQRRFKEKADAQLGHEAIRPADLAVREAGGTADEQALYRLIWQRAVASQMADATYTETALQLVAEDHPSAYRYLAKGRVPIELGWRRLTATDAADEPDEGEDEADGAGGQVPALAEGSAVQAKDGRLVKKVTRPPPRYTLASLAKKLEGLGIGRPATYASILTNIQDRGYVAVEARKLHATKAGMALVDALVKLEFAFMEYAYTRQLEERLDDVAGGTASYLDVVSREHSALAADVAKAAESKAVAPVHACPKCQRAMRRRKAQSGGYFWMCAGYPDHCDNFMDDKAGEPVERQSHPCPDCKRPMYRRAGKSGFFWACSGFKDGCSATLPDDRGRPGKRAEISAHACPTCGKGLIHRVKKGRGKSKGYDFWGCSGYPSCDYSCKSDAAGKPVGIKRAS